MNDLAIVAGWILALAALPLALAVGVFGLQVLAAAWSRAPVTARSRQHAVRGRVAVLVPAHDEAAGIAHTLAAVLPQLREHDRVLVVADNCSDDTAAIARRAGTQVQVVERRHDTDRGKGFALAFGVDALRADPPGLVVILDADCDLAPGALDALCDGVVTYDRPVQALYLMNARPDAGLPRRIAQFAWRVRNWVRPAGWRRLGLPCQLMGTGMAFTWPMLRGAPLANASIVEDMKLGIDLAIAGRPPLFCPRALVTSLFPDSAAATRSQRTRWEHGHLEMIVRELPGLLAAAWRRRDARLLGLALDLCVPPLALLAALLVAGTVLATLLSWWIADIGPGLAYGLLSGAFGAAVLLAWWTRGRDLVRPLELLSIPVYIAARLPVYARFVVRRERRWVRTDRDSS
jgi:cellulose synthase/poly-beta-1,6-N-acetylglucosamine synthase-like glycosyltransferase